MITRRYKCTLLSDIIINQKAATEGSQQTLDFIPGNNFLGIAASIYEELAQENKNMIAFHSQSIRFGDAFPLIIDDNGKAKKALRVPASFYTPKIKTDGASAYYQQYAYDQTVDRSNQQLKQCRKGFYVFEEGVGQEVPVLKSFAIKSAYDRKLRRSADQQMYGYESLQEGSCWAFDVCFDDGVPSDLPDKIEHALLGDKSVGRSRTAQYGLVRIEVLKEDLKEDTTQIQNDSYVLIYAESRLIFLDEFGLPTFTPQAKDLGFEDGDICWNKSQIRTFQYAPWNSKRQARDADRCGIEKGSVIYIDRTNTTQEKALFVGSYQCEGFGKILINPDFLEVKPNTNGEALYSLREQGPLIKNERTTKSLGDYDNKLFAYLQKTQNDHMCKTYIYEVVSDFVTNYKKYFESDDFASQWGAIRNIAMLHKGKAEITNYLTEYITNGVASDKWSEKKRCGLLRNFLDRLEEQHVQLAVINLASEMAKESRRKNNGK